MAFDFKKEYKEFYLPKNKPEILTVPRVNYIAVWGEGDPNQPGGDYQRAIAVLYAVAYTLKMSDKAGHPMEGFFQYVVPPLEGFWKTESGVIDVSRKDAFQWISAIRLPDFVTPEDLDWAARTAEAKKKLDCSSAQFWRVEEGLCVQMMHLGPFDTESASLSQMEEFLSIQGYETDLSDTRLHHEIYLSDARRVPPERWKTVLRHPIRRRKP